MKTASICFLLLIATATHAEQVTWKCGETVYTLLPEPGCYRLDTGEPYSEEKHGKGYIIAKPAPAPAPKSTGPTIAERACSRKNRCSQMNDCREARFYFSTCGMRAGLPVGRRR